MKNNTRVLFEYDLKLGKLVAGCDEAGRGPLAGPVVCAACIMPLDSMIDGIDDSKKIPEKRRETLYEQIMQKALAVKVSIINNERVDEINILNAAKEGMIEAIDGLTIVKPELVLIDAVQIPTKVQNSSIIRGDATSYNIAAASIIAKVARDRIMRELHNQYPQYNFQSNKGYGTHEHIAALMEFGSTQIHRQTFIKGILNNNKQ